MSICSENGQNSVSVPWPWPPHEYILYTPEYMFRIHSGHLELALLGFQFLNFRLKPFVDPMPVEL